MIDAVEPSDILAEEGSEICFSAGGCLSFSCYYPEGYHQPSEGPGAYPQIHEVEELQFGLVDYDVSWLAEDIGELTPEVDEDGGCCSQGQASQGADEHHEVVVFIGESEELAEGDGVFLFWGFLFFLLGLGEGGGWPFDLVVGDELDF